jgi:hypothetical protein
MVAVWYAGLTAVVLALAYRDRGLHRRSGIVILVAYVLFVVALSAVASGHTGPLVYAGPAVVVGLWVSVLLLAPPKTRPAPVSRSS